MHVRKSTKNECRRDKNQPARRLRWEQYTVTGKNRKLGRAAWPGWPGFSWFQVRRLSSWCDTRWPLTGTAAHS